MLKFEDQSWDCKSESCLGRQSLPLRPELAMRHGSLEPLCSEVVVGGEEKWKFSASN